MTFELTRKSYRFDMSTEDFLPIIQVESITNSRKIAEHYPFRNELYEILEADTPATCIEYDGHFGASIFFTIDVEDETDETLPQIQKIIEDYAVWAKEAMKKIEE